MVIPIRETKHYPHRYKYGKQTQPLTVEQLAGLMLKVKKQRVGASFHLGVDPLRDSSLLSVFYWTGLRISEVVGDRPRHYKVSNFTPAERERMAREGLDWKKQPNAYRIKTSPERPGIRKEDIKLDKRRNALLITALALKHGKREAPLTLSLKLPFVDLIKQQWERTEPGEKVWDLSREYAWEIMKEFHPKLYTHYYRLNRAMDFVDNPTTSSADLLSWFGWRRVQTAYHYLELGGRRIHKMSDLMVAEHAGETVEITPVNMEVKGGELIEEPVLAPKIRVSPQEGPSLPLLVEEGEEASINLSPKIESEENVGREKLEQITSPKDCPDCGGAGCVVLVDGTWECSECGYRE